MASPRIPVTAQCAKCGETKSAADFYRDSSKLNGLRGSCKKCEAAYSRAFHKRQRQQDGERIRANAAAWRKANPERLKELKRGHYERHRSKVIAAAKEYQECNRERRRKAQQAWRDRNREKVRASQRKAQAKKLATPKGKLESIVSKGIRYCLKYKKAGRTAFSLLPYTADELLRHIEQQFRPGMSWENHGEWHLDHIVPLAAHNYETAEDIDFQKAWAMENLRPLWASDNHRKSCKLLEPFQPSLALHGEG